MILSLEECLLKVEDRMKDLTHQFPEPVNLYGPVEYQMSLGGKRIRPAMLLMACNLFSDNVDSALMPAVAVEAFHNFTLIHDDIMDDSQVRRGKPAVHAKWSRNTAILSGDTLCILAYKYLRDTAAPSGIIDIFTKMAVEVCEGQQLDMDFETMDNVSEANYLEMIRLKTAVLIAASAQIGAICAGAPEEEALKLYRFGEAFGLAFQIQDDLLDVYADPQVLGKPIGGDIREDKKTWLLIKALEKADQTSLELLRGALRGDYPDPDRKYKVVRGVYDSLGIPELARQKIEALFKEATACIGEINVPSSRKETLLSLVHKLNSRNR